MAWLPNPPLTTGSVSGHDPFEIVASFDCSASVATCAGENRFIKSSCSLRVGAALIGQAGHGCGSGKVTLDEVEKIVL